MTVKLETESIRIMAAFEKLTKVNAKDCLITENCIYFVVDPKKLGFVIGKNGSVIKDVKKKLGKQVKVFGYYKNLEFFLKGMIPSIKTIEINDGVITISIPNEDKVNVIGKNGNNIKAIRELMARHFKIKNVRVK